MTFIQNLWRDLVDKRLWPVAVVLVLAAIATPILLGSDSSSDVASAPPPAAPATGAAAGDVTVAVTDTTKIRSRPGKARDPFRAQVFAKVKKAQAATGATTGATASPSASGATAGAVKPADTGSTATDSGKSSGSSTTGNSGVTVPSTTPSTSTSSSTKLFDYALSFESKRLGEVTTRRGVRAVNYVPSNDYPLLAFVGIKPDGKTAVFVPQDRVVVAGRDKDCTPASADCQFLELKAGDSVLIHKTPPAGNGQPIVHVRLKLNRITLTEVSKAKSRGKSTSRSVAPATQVTRTVRAIG
ncbi:hypothetical protein DSM112329_03078 [Paraconexibacter sp. AEG42_29]|uniref:Uncharacterized protein n=1 Tax=Paraconexibacter sp. AEG42_29 TaxID=2997339 RepID=A0AAU7AWW9_9ACTN